MASPAVTYTFANNTAADATQVNQNFTDLINGMTDGTKDFSISALTVAGTATFNGNTTFGNASGDDITFTGSLASSVPIKTDASFDIGSTTKGLRSVYFGGNSQRVDIKASSSMSATWTLTLPTTAGTANYALVTNGSGVTSWASVLNGTLNQYNVYLGNSSNAATSVNTNLLGDIKGTAGSFDFVDADVNTTNNTVTESSHGRANGDKCYLTTTGVLPGGLSASTTYYIIVTDANTIKFATTYANALSATAIDITSAAGGGTHTVNYGGLNFASSLSTQIRNYAQPYAVVHKNGSNQTWSQGANSEAQITFSTVGSSQGGLTVSSNNIVIPSGAAGIYKIGYKTYWTITSTTQTYTGKIKVSGTIVDTKEFISVATSSTNNESQWQYESAPIALADSDTVGLFFESTRNHSSVTTTISGTSTLTQFYVVKIF